MALHSRLAASAVLALLFLTPAIAGAQALNASGIAAARAQGILDDKANRTASEHKLDTNLLFAMRAARIGAAPNTMTAGVPAFVQSFIDSEVAADATVFVTIRASATADLATWLEGIGAHDIQEYAQFGGVTAMVPLRLVVAIADRPEVLHVGARELVETHRYFPELDAREKAAIVAAKIGSVTWQGVTAHQANLAHSAGITGTGAKVCVLSDGVNTIAARVTSGDLSPVDVLSGQAGSGDEGTAMLEIIHDMAPGAALGFATGFNGSLSFASNIVALRTTSLCDIIVDDLSYFAESAFQDDTIAQAVNTVTAAGALYFSSAANSGNLTHGHSGTFEGDFVASGAVVPPLFVTFEGSSALVLHSFGALPYTKLTKATFNVSLKWSDSNAHSGNDYDVIITDDVDPPTTIRGAGANSQTGTQNPVEVASCSSGCTLLGAFPIGSRIYIVQYNALTPAVPRAMHLDTHRGEITPANATTGSTFGHNAGAATLSVGTSDLRLLVPGLPFTTANVVTNYSSDGPRKVFYDAAGTAITGGNFLFGTAGGTTLAKVDLTASDCGVTSTPNFLVFCGTSAAAPTAAAIAALIKSAKPTATKAQVTTALLASALDIEQPGVDRNSGAGMVMVPAAVRGVLSALVITKAFAPSSISVGGTSVLTISVQNPNAIAINGTAFTDNYPVPVVNAPSPNTIAGGAGCTGSMAAAGSGNTFTVTNATIPSATTCTFSVTVTVNAGGTYNDTSGNLSTPIALNTPGGSATLTVISPTVQRAFVASYGSDSNVSTNCGLTAPCRSFATALNVVVSGGEIVALNAAGYGVITITRSVNIVANPGFYAGITAQGPDAVTIATPGVNVLLRGLNINGLGSQIGVKMTNGASLTIEDSVITNFLDAGAFIDAPSAKVRIANSSLSGNGNDGLRVSQGRADIVRSRANGNNRAGFAALTVTASATATLSIVDSFASGNMFGFAGVASAAGSTVQLAANRVTGASNSSSGLLVQLSTGTATAVVGNSMFTQNTLGMQNVGATLKSLGNNLVDLNGTNSSGTITALPGL